MRQLFRSKKQAKSPTGLTGVGLHADGVSLVRVSRDDGTPPVVEACEYVALESSADHAAALKDLCKRYDLGSTPCTVILSLDDYRLLMVEAPDVPPDELLAAMRWRVKDLLDFDVNDASLQVFEFPSVGASRERAVYLVAARNEAIQAHLKPLDRAGINVQIVDIPEMAQRNLAALLPTDGAGSALLSLSENGGLITLTREGVLYISRTLDIGLRALSQNPEDVYYLDRIATEVQRSLDYYVSHFRQEPVERLYVAPAPQTTEGLIDYLNGTVPTQPMALSKLLEWQELVPETVQAKAFFTLGAALRREEETA